MVLKIRRSLNAEPVMHTRTIRENWAAELEEKRPDPFGLTKQQQEEVLAYWQRFTRMEDTGWADLCRKVTGTFSPAFVPPDIFYAEIVRVLKDPYEAFGVQNKLLFRQLFHTVRQPELLLYREGGTFWDADGAPLTAEQALECCRRKKEVVCKMPMYTCGGSGVRLLDPVREEDALRRLLQQPRLLVQAALKQHPVLQAFQPTSVNTLRIMTYLRENGEVVVLSAVLRMGSGRSRVDNVSSGGCACGILLDGTLRSVGYTGSGQQIGRSPAGVPFAEAKIPGYPAAAACAMQLHRTVLPQFGLLGWDFAIDPQEQPVMIEVNIGDCSIDFMQWCNGPLLGSYAEEILKRVYRVPLCE